MKKYLVVAVLLACCAFPSSSGAEEVADDMELGWTPALANRWMEAQMNYSSAVQKHGADSPEATQAQVEMNTLARKLKIKPPQEVPQVGELKKPIQVTEPDEEDTASSTSTGPALNSPAPVSAAD